jgi:hypothetical protein
MIAEPKWYRSALDGRFSILAMRYASEADRASLEAWVSRVRGASITSVPGSPVLRFRYRGQEADIRLGDWLWATPAESIFHVWSSSWFDVEFAEATDPSTFSFDAENLSVLADIMSTHAGEDIRGVLKLAVAKLEAESRGAKAEGGGSVTAPSPEVHAAKRLRAAERLIDAYGKYVSLGEKGSVWLHIDRDPKQRDLDACELSEAIGEYNSLI